MEHGAILDVLMEAVTEGAIQILTVRSAGGMDGRYKTTTELVTTADERSDAAILAVFRARFPSIDPEISFHLEESGITGESAAKRAGADPLDGTNHFACGGQWYSVQAHYVEDGVPRCGVVFQPEAFLPLSEGPRCLGRIVYAERGRGAHLERTEFTGSGFVRSHRRKVEKTASLSTKAFVACVPFSTKMAPEERAIAQRVHDSGIIASTTGVGGAGGNVLMAVFGGQQVYANFGAGEDLDLVPPQVIAEEAGMTVWGTDRKSPVWPVRKQPFIVAPNAEIAERFFKAAGL